MRKISLVLVVLFMACILQACKTDLYSQIDDSYVKDFSIRDNKYLMIKDEYYVQNIETSNEISGKKDLGIICKNDKTSELTIENSFENLKGILLVINGLDIDKKTIVINGTYYKIAKFENEFLEALDLNELFEDIDIGSNLRLNPDNFAQFVDSNENIYELGKLINKEDLDLDTLSYQVKLGDEIITAITFNTETGQRLSSKDKTTMLTDSKGSKEIKTIFYGEIYKTKNGNFAVEVDGEYRELEPQPSMK
ncbi:MAG: hypothetical protein Q4P65_02780 [Eubacteriales bacterium]|nr:hypothetical protein [Eubacteriales bacterium]